MRGLMALLAASSFRIPCVHGLDSLHVHVMIRHSHSTSQKWRPWLDKRTNGQAPCHNGGFQDGRTSGGSKDHPSTIGASKSLTEDA